MLQQVMNTQYKPTEARALAEEAAIAALLRCFCREVAAPCKKHGLSRPAILGPLPAVLNRVPWILHITLSDRSVLMVGVEAIAPLHDYTCTTPVFRKVGRRFTAQTWEDVATIVYTETATLSNASPNSEIMDQTRNSVAVTERLVAHRLSSPLPGMRDNEAVQTYFNSESNLLFGHPSHPTPKSREGIDIDLLAHYAPETRQSFDLHYVEVEPQFLWTYEVAAGTCNKFLEHAMPTATPGASRIVIPVHPIQAEWLLHEPAVARALSEGWLRDLGILAKPYRATSSVRTIINPHDLYFLKLSLHVRMTNCVRKNAAYELESAVAITSWLNHNKASREKRFPHLRVLDEPVSYSIDAPHFDSNERQTLIEGFGTILRESFLHSLDPGETPLVAGGLFSSPVCGSNWLNHIVGTNDADRLAWFDVYVTALVPPILYCLFHEGIVFEPHLQNVVVGVVGKYPRTIYLRDLEGTKRTPRARPLDSLGHAARRSMEYTKDAGWQRVAYCLFVNHLGEAIRHLANGRDGLRTKLWHCVANTIADYQREYGTIESASRLLPLLKGDPLPAKTLLLTRFHQRPDREARSISVGNPMIFGGW